MSATERDAARILASPASGSFDDLGALVAAVRSMLDGAGLSDLDRSHAYCLATMAEEAWQRLNSAMQGQPR